MRDTRNRERLDLTGLKRGRLQILGLLCYYQHQGRWLCKCECGNITTVSTGALKNHTQSCGCLRHDTLKVRGRKTLPMGQAPLNQLFCRYRIDARKRNLQWSLSPKDFQHLVFSNCFYCGVAPYRIKRRRNEQILYNGIDRVCNAEGYNSANCVTACKTCNYAKHSMNHEEFIAWLQRAGQYQIDRSTANSSICLVEKENEMSKRVRDSKDPMPTGRNTARVGGGNTPYPAGAEDHGDGTAERVTASQNRTTGPEARRVAQPTRQNGDGNTSVSGETHNSAKAERVSESQRW